MTKDEIIEYLYENHTHADFKVEEIAEDLAEPEIIRCKDCKHRPFDSEDTQGFGVEFPDEKCPFQCEDGWYNWRPNNEWFCANAEGKEGEADG